MKNLLALSTALPLFGSIALAQPAVSDTPYDEIVVRAQKRDQSIREVPAAITAFNQDSLDDLGVQQFDDLADFIPGLEVQEQSANNPGFSIRGLTSDNGAANIEPRVSIFQDGVPNSRSRGSFVEVFDTNVEVLRGPQPTLFGRSALIGAISLNSIRPDADAGVNGYARVGFGSYNFQFAEGAVNLPVSETLAVRLAGRFKQRDGYITATGDEDDFQGFETGAIRASALWEPNDDFSALLIGNYQYDDNPGTSFKSGTFRPFGGSTDPFAAASLNFFGGPLSEGKTELGLERELYNGTLRLDYQLTDVLSVTTISAYREFDSDEVFDPDGFQYDLFVFAEDAEGEQFSQEIRFNYDNGDRLAGFFGFNYFDESGEQRVPLRYNQNVVGALLSPNPMTGLPLLFTAPPGVEQEPLPLSVINSLVGIPDSLALFEEVFGNTSEAQTCEVFADATYKVTDRFELTAGLRYTRDEKETGQFSFSQSGAGSLLTGAGVFLGAAVLTNDGMGFRTADDIVTASDEFDGWTGRVAANYEVSDELSVFANYARGRRPEVLNFGANAARPGLSEDQFNVIDAETVDSFELGAKGRFLEGALQADASFYYYDYTNFQTSVAFGVGDIQTVNAGGATAYGVEGTFTYTPVDWLSVFGNYAWNDATFDDESDEGVQQAFGGNRFRLSPEHAVTVGTELRWDSSFGEFAVRSIYSYRSEVFFDDDNDRRIDLNDDGVIDINAGDLFQDEVQDGYGVLDIRATWTSTDGLYKVEIFGENVLDEEYLLDAGNTGDAFGIPTFIAAAPATFGAYLSVAF
ncbi:MAG: TonB-dependent receptor [Parvularculaceae bacterium]|nr:TonB-dependent receptor [Parvularculaceae bacterium]